MKLNRTHETNVKFISTSLLAVGGVALVGVIQLLLSTVMAADIYELASLKREHHTLVIDAQIAEEEVYKLNQLNNLENMASRMGMIPSVETGYLYLED